MGGLVTKGLIRGWGMCNDNCYGLTAWSKCHLGGAIPGHHGLLRLQLKGLPSALGRSDLSPQIAPRGRGFGAQGSPSCHFLCV